VILARGLIVLSCLLATFTLFLNGCKKADPDPIRIGFVAGMTGRMAPVSIPARDGALLAIKQVNEAGGIDGRKLELIIYDDKQDRDVARAAVRSLISEGVPVIIGPLTSTMAVEMVPIVNRSKTLLISPTASTTSLSRQDDNFLRLRPQCVTVVRKLVNYIVDQRHLKKIGILLDVGNSAYTEDWQRCFSRYLEEKDGEVVSAVSFVSGDDHLFGALAGKILKSQPEGILVLANPLDTAIFSQQLAKKGVQIPLFTSEWSMTRDLLTSGGRSVEGITLFHVFNEASKKKKYLEFKDEYRAYFGQEPSFPVIHGFDTMQVVIAGLKRGARTGPELKKVLLQTKEFDALQTVLRFDPYGDIERDLFLTVVKDGEFVVVE